MALVLVGDCIEKMRGLEDRSVHTCVTSPPYFGLRDYGMDGQIGLEDTPDAFVARLVEVFREVRRVLRDDGTLFLNLGDSYFGGGGGSNGSKQQTNKGALIPGHTRAGVRRAAAYGTSGKEPANYQESDCLCGSLCDACRRAYQIGKSHSDTRLAPTLAPSIASSIPEHTGSPFGHLPTSDLMPPAGRSEAAIHGPAQTERHASALLPAAPASTLGGFSQPHQEAPHQSDQPSECRLCGCSLPHSVPASSHMVGCNCGTSARGSVSGIAGRGVVSSAYPHLTIQSLKSKDLIGIPWRVAFALQADGWYLRQDIIWHKPNPMPESVRDRCTKAHEYIFLLSKSERYYFDSEAIKEKAAEGSRGFNGSPSYADGDRNDAGRRDRSERETRNKRSVWTVTTKPFKGAHFATFPPDLIEPCVLAGSPVGGTVLDPFGGSGTTAGVAEKHGRKAILCELNPAYAAMIPARIMSIARTRGVSISQTWLCAP